MVEKVRVSVGTAMRLGLVEAPPQPSFTTAFLMTYHPTRCSANCAFCPQARESSASADRLSRISWPEYGLQEVLDSWPIRNDFERVCIQTLCYDDVVDDVVEIAEQASKVSQAPISTAVPPLSSEDMKRLRDSGIEDIGIALDACTPRIFARTKGEETGSTYRWSTHLGSLRDALQVFGPGHVTTHLIVGLGETEEEASDFIFDMAELGVTVGLFAFTAVDGTNLRQMPSPELDSYRRIQVVRYLVERGQIERKQVQAKPDGKITISLDTDQLVQHLGSGNAFRVSGCKGCNRPYYNESPRGPMYNYHRDLSEEEVAQAMEEAGVA
ncbi:radical SAM protein [Candidatus Thorarchaeota archaeon]|nr:MAG: radical SAM protein [Candidatus Thorarchaeota archaeon]